MWNLSSFTVQLENSHSLLQETWHATLLYALILELSGNIYLLIC